MKSISSGSTVALRQQVLSTRRKHAKGAPKASVVAIYAGIFALIVAVVSIGYHAPQKSSAVADSSSLLTSTVSGQTSVDQVLATDIASNVAKSTNLSIAPNIANFAVSTQIQAELPQTSDTVISKPAIVQPDANNRTIVSYVAQAGDTVTSLSIHYGITQDTIKWANNLTTDAIAPGKTLIILPIDGVLYTVKAGDTLASISSKYGVDPSRVTLYNDLDVTGIVVGNKIILPGGILPNTERPGYVAPIQYYTNNFVDYSGGDVKFLGYFYGPVVAGNTATPGQCTWYVWDHRVKMGYRMPAGAVLGNASDWAYTLGRLGYSVNRGHPSVGAIMQNGGGAGHVAFVEGIADNGDVTVTEMNYGYRSFMVDQRIISAGQAVNYTYIQ
jgi:surface antigen/nucleoid-associated protein YgaU